MYNNLHIIFQDQVLIQFRQFKKKCSLLTYLFPNNHEVPSPQISEDDIFLLTLKNLKRVYLSLLRFFSLSCLN